jgi:arginine-tRNA-protein transferase
VYKVDGHLVGISVIDILPSCVSSVYFIWDPDWAWASLGKLSALREVGLVREMARKGAKGMGWLYMGSSLTCSRFAWINRRVKG